MRMAEARVFDYESVAAQKSAKPKLRGRMALNTQLHHFL
jgi:hypothetical protein